MMQTFVIEFVSCFFIRGDFNGKSNYIGRWQSLEGNTKSIYISADLLKEIRFVDRGKFVESDGEPVLSIVGEVKSVKDIPVAVSIREKEIALSDNRILDVFLQKENVTNGKEYISYIVNVSAKNFPIFVFCKYFLDKVAKHFWTLLHVQIGQSCKAL